MFSILLNETSNIRDFIVYKWQYWHTDLFEPIICKAFCAFLRSSRLAFIQYFSSLKPEQNTPHIPKDHNMDISVWL